MKSLPQRNIIFSFRGQIIQTLVLLTFSLYTNFLCAQSVIGGDYFNEVLRTTKDFQEIEKKIEKYYSDKDKGKGSGYKQWKRWQHFYSNRLLPNGTIPNLEAVELEEVNKSTVFQNKKAKNKGKSQTSGKWSNVNLDSYVRFGNGYNGGIGRVNCVVVDPDNDDIIYIGTPAGGLWRSNNAGNSWEPLSDNLVSIGISGIAIDYNSPKDNRTIYILTGDGDGKQTESIGVLKSINNGKTWEKTGLTWNVRDNKYGYKLVINPTNSNILMAAMEGGLYRTVDAGKTWELSLSETSRIYDIEFKPRSATVYASGTGEFFKSTNGGEKWKKIQGIANAEGRTAIAVSSKRASLVYLLFGSVVGSGQFGGLYRSTDSGNTFELRSNRPNVLGYSRFGGDNLSLNSYCLSLAVSPDDVDEIHIGGINCWKSIDGGSNWVNTSYWRENLVSTEEYTHADIHTLEYVGNTLFVGSDGGVYKSDDKAESWESISNGLNISQPYKIGLDPTNAKRFVFGSQDNGSNKYENSTYFHWFGADGFESIIDPANPERIYGSFQFGGLNRSDDGGETLVTITPKDDKGNVLRGVWSTPYTLDPENSNVIYGGYGIDLYKTDDSGNSWINFTNGKVGFGNSNHIAIAPSDNKYMYLIKGHLFYYTHDGGNSWEEKSISKDVRSLTYIAVNPVNPKELWITLGDFVAGKKVYKSIDGGVTFANVSGTLPNIPVNCIVYEKGSNDGIYIGTDLGVFYKNNTLSDWQLYANNLPNTIVTELEIQYLSRKIYAATFGRGIWYSDLYPSVSGGEVEDPEVEPCITSNNSSWNNTTIDNLTSNFEVRFSVKPNDNNMDGVIGLSNKNVDSFGDMGVIIRFNKRGAIDVRNGGNYMSSTTLSYEAGNTYNFKIAVNLKDKKYSVYASNAAGNEQLIAEDYSFRTEQALLTNINNWTTFSGQSTLTVCNFKVDNGTTNTFPTVIMTSPTFNDTFEEGSTITLSSNANDPDGEVVRVTWFQNGKRIRSDSGSPYSKPWENVPAGNYQITATAEDNDGAIVTSDPISIKVKPKEVTFCETSNSSWGGKKTKDNLEGAFITEFVITPNQNNMDGVIGLSDGAADSYADLALILRLNKNGEFDVRNGGKYSQSSELKYEAGTNYKVRFEVNIVRRKYNVVMTIPSGDEVKIADNFDFRTESANIDQLNHWGWISGIGSLEICLPASEIIPEPDQEPAPTASIQENKIGLSNKATIVAFPNPTSNKVTFINKNSQSNIRKIKIIDIASKVLMDLSNDKGNNVVQLDMSYIPNGIYIAKIYTDIGVLNKKIVIKK